MFGRVMQIGEFTVTEEEKNVRLTANYNLVFSVLFLGFYLFKILSPTIL